MKQDSLVLKILVATQVESLIFVLPSQGLVYLFQESHDAQSTRKFKKFLLLSQTERGDLSPGLMGQVVCEKPLYSGCFEFSLLMLSAAAGVQIKLGILRETEIVEIGSAPSIYWRMYTLLCCKNFEFVIWSCRIPFYILCILLLKIGCFNL